MALTTFSSPFDVWHVIATAVQVGPNSPRTELSQYIPLQCFFTLALNPLLSASLRSGQQNRPITADDGLIINSN